MSAITSTLTMSVVPYVSPDVKIVRLVLCVDTHNFVGIRTADFSWPLYYIIDASRATTACDSSVYSWS